MEFVNQYSTVIIYAIAVIVALFVVLILWRAYSQRVRGRRGQRLGISEYHELDQSRRLVLVRRDNVEHLILIGGPADVVVEGGIGQPLRQVYASAREGENDVPPRPMAPRPAPRAPAIGDRNPPPLRPVERTEPPLTGGRDTDRT